MPLLPGGGRGKGGLRQVPQLLLFRVPLGSQEQSAQGMAQCLVAWSMVTVVTGSLGKGSMDLVYLASRFRGQDADLGGDRKGPFQKGEPGPRKAEDLGSMWVMVHLCGMRALRC